MAEKVEAIAKYEPAAGSGKIALEKGQIITLIKKTETGWWYGQNAAGEKGYFPSTYIKPYVDANAPPLQPPPPAPATASVLSPTAERKAKVDMGELSDLMSQISTASAPLAAVRSAGAAPVAAPRMAAPQPQKATTSASVEDTTPAAPPVDSKNKVKKTAGAGWIAAAASKSSGIEVILVPPKDSTSTDPFRQTWDDSLAREAFREFCYQEEAVEGIIFCEHVERWKQGMIPGCSREFANPEKILSEARRIYSRYLDPDPEIRKSGPAAELEVNVAGDVKADVAKKIGILSGGVITPVSRVSEDIFDSAVDDVLNYLKQGVFPRFLKSSHYDKYQKSKLLDSSTW